VNARSATALNNADVRYAARPLLIKTQMSKKHVIDQTAFDLLLFWLNPDREKAAQKYESVRRRLIELFASRGFSDADRLADDTIDRVVTKVPQVSQGWVGDPLHYFLAVAKKIILENTRPLPVPEPFPVTHDPEELEREDRCLEHCLELVSHEERKLILEYVDGKKKDRHDQAEKLGISANALRIRIYQIKKTITPCIKECLGQEVS
jgi:DNA-directed RNA polymerase specialized sigma24 family protein